MSRRLVVRNILLGCSTLLLLELAWLALSGAVRQWPRSRTAGQKTETVLQLACGLLSWLTVLTCFRWRRWAEPVRAAWGLSLAAAAGLSALVWGLPMPVVGLLFTALGLTAARSITWALRTAHAA